METENITLKPIPPKIINCSACKKIFTSIFGISSSSTTTESKP